MQKESTNLDKRFERYSLRKVKFKFKQFKFFENLVLQYSPDHYGYTVKRIDEFGVTYLKIQAKQIWVKICSKLEFLGYSGYCSELPHVMLLQAAECSPETYMMDVRNLKQNASANKKI